MAIKSIFETRRATATPFGNEKYLPLRNRLGGVTKKVQKIVGDSLSHEVTLRWEITETKLFRDQMPGIIPLPVRLEPPTEDPVLIVEMSLIYEDTLWLVRRLPFILTVAQDTNYLEESPRNGFVKVFDAAIVIGEDLKMG